MTNFIEKQQKLARENVPLLTSNDLFEPAHTLIPEDLDLLITQTIQDTFALVAEGMGEEMGMYKGSDSDPINWMELNGKVKVFNALHSKIKKVLVDNGLNE